MLLSKLNQKLPAIEIGQIIADSRKIKAGDLFVALSSISNPLKVRDYIDQAIRYQASAIILEQDLYGYYQDCDGVEIIPVSNVAKVYGEILSNLYKGEIPRNLYAVTGTDGKSSTVNVIAQLLYKINYEPVITLGTMGVQFYGVGEAIQQQLQAKLAHIDVLTTFNTTDLYQCLYEVAKIGINYVVLEASSHGLEQYRLWGLEFNSAGFTSFSQDHLDYHQDMDSYLQAKLRLCDQSPVMVVNDEIGQINKIKEYNPQQTVTYGKSDQCSLQILSISYQKDGILADFKWKQMDYEVILPFTCEFEVYNAFCGLLMLLYDNYEIDSLLLVMSSLTTIAGRLERVSGSDRRHIYIDYAHTPGALQTILSQLKLRYSNHRLIVVFGAGGNRDQEKRVTMGKIAGEFADIVIVTDDNPRHENPANIRAQIIAGCNQVQGSVIYEVGDRTQAIAKALDLLDNNDALVIAGKGHENYQIIEDQKLPYNDRDVVHNLLKIGLEHVATK